MEHCNCFKQSLTGDKYKNVPHAPDCPAPVVNELLEALEQVQEELRKQANGTHGTLSGKQLRIYKITRAAIAKAKGD